MTTLRIIAALCAAAATSHAVHAQSLFLSGSGTDPLTEANPAEPIRGLSLTLVEPPVPREYEIHDIITIIVDESSSATAKQELDTEKEYLLSAGVRSFINPRELAQGTIRTTNPALVIDAGYGSEYEGEGEYRRIDRMTTRITATIIDVKPNGNLVLEAKKTVGKDAEIQTVVLAGMCRGEDVTDNNTILSTQLADLVVMMINEGEVKKGADKGVITKALDTVFNF